MKTMAPMIAVLITTVSVSAAHAQDPGSTGYDEAWAQIQKLAGTWDSYVVGREDSEQLIRYHVTSGGAVVLEEFVGDTPEGVRSMATAYHRDGSGLVATHYCGAGNQPRMRAASYDPEQQVVRFDFWDVTNLASPQAYHTTNIELHFQDDDHVELRFRGTEDGVDQTEWQVHRLRRLSERPSEPRRGEDAERILESLVAGAVEPLPAELRGGAEVRRWDGYGSLLTVRGGSNGMICLADDPTDDRFHSACYHRSLEEFMAVGRRLRAEGLSGLEYQEARWAEIDAGRLRMPSVPTMVYNYFHDDPSFDPGRDDPSSGSRLHAVYLPGMTGADTGLGLQGGSAPWLMWPGKPSSHIMISVPG